ncbi:MAG: DUF4240 domain-containing protein [Gemmataceae bacterium]|nr:DUF4240 domain-containing protein [Gemmataceae bacterium]
MDPKQFWQIIADADRPDLHDHVEALREQLDGLKWFDVVDFQITFEKLARAANRPDLWAAAWLVNGDSSPLSFRNFRVWLVGRGREVYEAALRAPDTLADALDGGPADGFGLDRAALRVYESKTGMSDFYTQVPEPDLRARPEGGIEVSDETELRARFPRLSDRYPPPEDDFDDLPE